MVFVEGEDYRALRRPGDDPAAFRSVVRLPQVPAAPDSVVHQYRGENFTTSTWTDSVGSADMSLNGVSASTLNGSRAASSDGVDDFGRTTTPAGSGPESLPNNKKFGVAIVLSAAPEQNTDILGFFDGANAFELNDKENFDNSTGEIQLVLSDGSNAIRVESKTTATQAFDSSVHLIVVQKTGATSSDVDIYIDDMTTDISTVNTANSFDETAFSANEKLDFFALNSQGTSSNFKQSNTSFIEFNSDPYNSTERQDLKQRAPGL